MNRTFVPVEESFKSWDKDKRFLQAYRDLEDEFALAAALIDAREHAGLSQEAVAAQMRTSQQAISRLEGGRGNPSLETLKRFAKATGTRLHIRFETARRR